MKNSKGTQAHAILHEYADLLRENDNQIRRLEALTGLLEPTSSQQARIAELENAIKAGIVLEKEKGAAIRALVDKLSKAEHRAVIRMRYFDLLGWWDVVYALYGDDADYTRNKLQHQRRAFRHHTEAIKKLDLLLVSRPEA